LMGEVGKKRLEDPPPKRRVGGGRISKKRDRCQVTNTRGGGQTNLSLITDGRGEQRSPGNGDGQKTWPGKRGATGEVLKAPVYSKGG